MILFTGYLLFFFLLHRVVGYLQLDIHNSHTHTKTTTEGTFVRKQVVCYFINISCLNALYCGVRVPFLFLFSVHLYCIIAYGHEVTDLESHLYSSVQKS